MIYSQQQKDSILYQSQIWLSELGFTLASLERDMQPCDDLYCKGYKIRTMITALQKDTKLSEQEQEYIYTCMAVISGIKDYPVFTPIIGQSPPSIIIGQPGPAGPPGTDGINGTDADINCISEDDEITIETRNIGGVKTFVWTHTPYIEPAITLNLDPSTPVVEIGNIIDVTLNISLLKGRDDVTESVILSYSTLNIAYQNILDLPGLNAGGSPNRSITDGGKTSTTTYTVNISDDSPPLVKDTASSTITFVYPFFDGATNAASINPYIELTKQIVTKSSKTVYFNGVDKYFWFCYPASYGLLSSIKDQNGFEVLSAFTIINQDVTSTGLVNNWTEPYYLYRTTEITDINGDYTFSF